MKDMIALYGGEKIKSTPFGTGKRFGAEELRQLEEALEQNTLFYWFGSKVKQLTKKFSELYGIPYCTAVSSGTAAIHTALGAVGVTEGDYYTYYRYGNSDWYSLSECDTSVRGCGS